MLGLFYSTQRKKMMSEGLYRQVLDKLDFEKDTIQPSYNLVMALNFYGRMLLDNPKRTNEANSYLKQSEELSARMPYWYDKIDSIYMAKWDLE
jgi:hypothetical protein